MQIQDLLANPDLVDALIGRIAEEVIRRLNNRPQKALVLISGGVIGYKEAAAAVKQLVADDWDVDVFASEAAVEIFGVDQLKKDLGVDTVYHEGGDYDSKALVGEADTVVIAEMTINTAAKIAMGIADNELTTLVRNAIMSGKRLVAAVDGACPDNAVRAELGMNKAPKAYHDMLHNHLVTLASYEIYLTQAENLYDAVKDKKTAKAPESSATVAPVNSAPAAQIVSTTEKEINKHVISRRDILENQSTPALVIPADALLTHSASDLADELGINISRR